MEVRVRFAPSPTGALHIGGVRTALYNFLFARKSEGKLILRIEDTDQTRFLEGAEEYIMNALSWAGIKMDEGPHVGGSYGPYRQSERLEIYKKYAEELINNKKAYYAFDDVEKLKEERLEAESLGSAFLYNYASRISMINSLTLSEYEVNKRIAEGEPHVIRLRLEQGEEVIINDLVRGKVVFSTDELDDKILFKSDGYPTYHLANVVDDYLMKISHVIRGEEWLPSCAHHVLLYKAFGWEEKMPKFAHLPLILKPQGNGKLSKRDGDKLGIPVFPLTWIKSSTEIFKGFDTEGFLPEALCNFMALLGWNPGTEQEIMSLEEMIQIFSLEKVGKSGSRFDIDKAKWINHQHIMRLSTNEIVKLIKPHFENNFPSTNKNIEPIIELFKERAVTLLDFVVQSRFFFFSIEEFDVDFIQKKWHENSSKIFQDLSALLSKIDPFEAEDLESQIKNYLQENNINLGTIFPLLRLAITGFTKGADLFKIMEICGKELTIDRIQYASLNFPTIKNVKL